MRRPLFALPTLLLASLAPTLPANAQGTVPTSSYNLSWANLDPGTDWSAQVILSLFPVSPAPGGATSTGAASTVIGTLVGTMTGFIAAIAMAWLCYGLIMQIFRGAETARVLDRNMSAMFLVRMGFAAVMMMPLPSGFSAGQKLVVQTALWGAGLGKAVYGIAVKAIGPDAMMVVQPIVPGTKTIVANLIQVELCRDLVNAAANTTDEQKQQVVPIPSAITSDPPGATAATGGFTTWFYGLFAGNATDAATCGTITLRRQAPNVASSAGVTGTSPSQGYTIAGVNVDMTSTQLSVLNKVITTDIRPQVAAVAQAFWTTRKVASLTPLMGVLTAASNDYSLSLANAATAKSAEIRASLQNATDARNGNVGLATGMAKLSDLGWTQAGAYFLEFTRLNGQTLSLVSSTPVVNTPSWAGLSKSMARDVAPIAVSATAFMSRMMTYVQTNDGLDVAAGNADLFDGATPGQDGAGFLEQMFRGLHLNESLLKLFTDGMLPAQGMWTDPFGTLMRLGNNMATLALTGIGTVGLLSSTVGTMAAMVGTALTGNLAATGGALAGHVALSVLGPPILTMLMGILVPGLMIAFVLPMIPWLMFIAGVIGWLILVCEAVIALPLWMLAHLTFNGEGVHGRAQEGYALLFNILVRPPLMIFGLFLGYEVFAASSYLIRQGFGVAAGFVLSNGWFVTNVIGVVVMLCIFVMAHIAAALLSFRMITLLPHHLPKMIGFSATNRVDMEQFGRDAALLGTVRALQTIQGGLTPSSLGNTGQRQASPGNSVPRALPGPSSRAQGATNAAGMDSTLQAATDVPPGQQEPPKEG